MLQSFRSTPDQRIAEFQVNFPKRQNSDRRMAGRNSNFSSPKPNLKLVLIQLGIGPNLNLVETRPLFTADFNSGVRTHF